MILFLIACSEPPTYNLPELPSPNRKVNIVTPTNKQKVLAQNTPEKKEEAPPPENGFSMDLSDGCIFSYEYQDQEKEDLIDVSLSVAGDIDVQQFFVDVLQPVSGEVYSASICPTQNMNFKIPKNLGSVQFAVFADTNENGPSKNDPQILTSIVEITDSNIEISAVELGNTPIPRFQKDDSPPPIVPEK